MGDERTPISAAAHFVHARLVWFLVGSYVLAALWPGPGLRLRGVSLGTATLAGERVELSLPAVLLGFLLLNAGLGVRLPQAEGVFRRPFLLGAGLAANLIVPITFIAVIALVFRWWPNPEEYRNMLVGLALIAAMPIAGSSAAWSRTADGDLALSLGLILASTLLSPLTTPAVLRAVGAMASGEQADDLRGLAGGGTGLFLILCVALPSIVGILLRGTVGGKRVDAAGQLLKLTNAAVLLVLCYANASVALPQAVAYPDPDYLVLSLVVTAGLCAAGFAAGWWVARRLRADGGQETALMFGLGMNNNGTGLVLAATALADHPQTMLPVLFYNLIQHLTAGVVNNARKPTG